MHAKSLLHHLIDAAADREPESIAVVSGSIRASYGELQTATTRFGAGLFSLGLARGERVAIYLDKRIEFVVAAFGTSAAGGVFVPVNPILKAEQVGHILRDCNVRVLVTTVERLAALGDGLAACHDLRQVVLIGAPAERPTVQGAAVHLWDELMAAPPATGHRAIDSDMTAILYTSGSTGRPKGVVLSHRNMMAGARSVAHYLGNHAGDTLLAALPLSFDAGLSQLSTAFQAGARVVLLNWLLPRDVLKAIERERVTGLTAVPPLWIQLAQLDWPAHITEHLRYIANTGGRMPLDTLTRLRAQLPQTRPFLMYGLTEAFRATYLAPQEVDRRPDSIGRAIPDAEVLVLREDGTEIGGSRAGMALQKVSDWHKVRPGSL